MRRYWRVCEEDNVTIVVEVHPDAGPGATMLDPTDWEGFGLTCPVCGDTETWEGGDPTTTRDDEQAALRRLHLSYVNDLLVPLLDEEYGTHTECPAHGVKRDDSGCIMCRAVGVAQSVRDREAARAG